MTLDINRLIQPTAAYKPAITDPILLPYRYISEVPSSNQNVRTRFLIAFNELFYQIKDKTILDSISEVISIFHNSSLLIDDIEDGSQYRRGLPVAHMEYGTPLTINCGNLMYFVAVQKAIELSGESGTAELKFEMSQILIDEMLSVHHGQGLDIYWRDYLKKLDKLPEVEDYLAMVKDKTGSLFRLAVKLLLLHSNIALDNDSLVSIANSLGIIYQIRDDYLNLVDKKYSAMKGVSCEDLIEGKLSLPILHCLRTTENSPVHDILYNYESSTERCNKDVLIEECLSFMKHKSKSLQYTLELLKNFENKVKLLLSKYPNHESSALMKIIDRLCDFSSN